MNWNPGIKRERMIRPNGKVIRSLILLQLCWLRITSSQKTAVLAVYAVAVCVLAVSASPVLPE